VRISAEEKQKIMLRIIDVAEQKICRDGLSGINLRALAKSADIKSASLYNHFKGGLDEVILQVNSRTIQMMDKKLQDAVLASTGKPTAVLFKNMAIAYLHFAIDHDRRFAALFEHRMSGDQPIPDWHLQEHYNLFRHVEKPLSGINVKLGEEERRILARTIYSSVHGVVHLGRQGRLMALPVPVIEQQLSVITQVLADGLTALAEKVEPPEELLPPSIMSI
jgi:AcrR family transcriptional regulator